MLRTLVIGASLALTATIALPAPAEFSRKAGRDRDYPRPDGYRFTGHGYRRDRFLSGTAAAIAAAIALLPAAQPPST